MVAGPHFPVVIPGDWPGIVCAGCGDFYVTLPNATESFRRKPVTQDLAEWWQGHVISAEADEQAANKAEARPWSPGGGWANPGWDGPPVGEPVTWAHGIRVRRDARPGMPITHVGPDLHGRVRDAPDGSVAYGNPPEVVWEPFPPDAMHAPIRRPKDGLPLEAFDLGRFDRWLLRHPGPRWMTATWEWVRFGPRR